MNSISIVLSVFVAVLVTVCLGQQSSARTWPIASYLGSRELSDVDPAAFDWIKTIIEEKNLSQPEEILAFFEETKWDMANNLRSFVRHNEKTVTVGFQVNELVRLAEEEPMPDRTTVENFLKLVQHVFGSVESMGQSSPASHHVGLFNYLRAYGDKKFANAIKSLNSEFETSMEGFKNTEMALDELVLSLGGDQTRSQDDKYLAQLASNMDLVGGQFDRNELLKAAKRYRLIEKDRRKKTMKELKIRQPFMLWDPERTRVEKRKLKRDRKKLYLFTFIGDFCTGLMYHFGNLLDVYNINRALSPESLSAVQLPEKLIKLNEYGRICHQRLDSATRQQVRENTVLEPATLKGSVSKLAKKVAHSG